MSKESSPVPEAVEEKQEDKEEKEDPVAEDKEDKEDKQEEKIDMASVLDEMFKNRYTEEDESYMKTIEKEKEPIPPPIVADWRYSYSGR